MNIFESSVKEKKAKHRLFLQTQDVTIEMNLSELELFIIMLILITRIV